MMEKKVRKTMFDYILWVHDIELREVEKLSTVNYMTLFQLKKGVERKFSFKTLNKVAKSLGIPINSFYDLENQKHRFLDDANK